MVTSRINRPGRAASVAAAALLFGSFFSGVSSAEAQISQVPIDLGLLPGGTFSDAYTLNDRGTVMGVAIPPNDGGEQAASWDSRHRITGLGTLPGMDRSEPKGIGSRGVIAGDAFPAPGYFRQAVKWDSRGRITALGAAAGFEYSWVVAINDRDTVIGEAYNFSDGYRAVRWNRDGIATLLPLPQGAIDSQARAIDNAGEIVGNSGNVPLRWDRDGRVTLLDTLGGEWSSPQAINDAGIAVGYGTDPAGRIRAIEWDAQGHATDLGTLGGAHSDATAINDRGEVLGTASTADGTNFTVRWDRGGHITALPGIDFPVALNDRGEVLGRTALWSPDGRTTRLAPLPDGDFATANGMNDNAVVGLSNQVGDGGSVYHAVLWPRRTP